MYVAWLGCPYVTWSLGDQLREQEDDEQVVTASAQEAEQQIESAQELSKNGEEGVKEEKAQDNYEQQEEKDEDTQERVKDEGGEAIGNQPDADDENAPAPETAMETGDTKSDIPSAAAEEVKQERAEVQRDEQESAPRDNGQAERMEASEERPGQWRKTNSDHCWWTSALLMYLYKDITLCSNWESLTSDVCTPNPTWEWITELSVVVWLLGWSSVLDSGDVNWLWTFFTCQMVVY